MISKLKSFNGGRIRSTGKVKSIKNEVLVALLPFVFISMVVLSSLGYFSAHRIIENNINKERQQSLSTAIARIGQSLDKNNKYPPAQPVVLHFRA